MGKGFNRVASNQIKDPSLDWKVATGIRTCSYLSVVEEEDPKAQVSLVNYDLSRQEEAGLEEDCKTAEKGKFSCTKYFHLCCEVEW